MKVLSIDGGGMRGVYSATYLAALEQATVARRGLPAGLDIGKAFDLIVGTSTGAIIGCGLALGLTPQSMADLYRMHGPEIFPKKVPGGIGPQSLWKMMRWQSYIRRGERALRSALEGTFGKATIGSLWNSRKIALAIPSVKLGNYKPWVFKTPHLLNSNHRDDGYSLVDVCMATSAAPIFRSLAALDSPQGNGFDVFADGGLWANNPALVALAEALRMVGEEDDSVEIFCLGTCGKPEGEVIAKSEVNRSIMGWRFGANAAKLSVAAQEQAFDDTVRMLIPHLKKKVQIVRFPANKIPGALLKYLDLDETSTMGLEQLSAQARADADLFNASLQRGEMEAIHINELFNSMPVRAE